MFQFIVLWIKAQLQDLVYWNQDDKCIVIVRYGTRVRLTIGRRIKTLEQGIEYRYGKNLLIVPVGEEWTYFGGRRVLGVAAGELVSCPFKGTGKLQDETWISEFCQGSAMTRLYGSYAGSVFNWKWILLIGGIGLALFVGYQAFFGGGLGFLGGGGVPTPTPLPTFNPGVLP